MGERCPRVSIIIPSRNGQRTIGKCLASIGAIDYPDFEVIVINDGSFDDTGAIIAEYVRKHPNVQLIKTDGVGPSAARNLGIAKATGEFLAFTDDDCIVDRQWLKELLRGFEWQTPENDRTAGVGGSQLSPEDDSNFGKSVNGFLKAVGFVADYMKADDAVSIRLTGHNPTCNVMYRKDVVVKCGGFTEGLWPGEDVEFDRRLSLAGYVHQYNPKAVVYHYRPDNVQKFVRMMYRYGKVQAYLARQFGFFRKIQYEPLVLVTYLMAVILSMARPMMFAGLLLIPLVLTSLFFFLSSRQTGKMLRFVCLFILTMAAWNLGFAAGIIGIRK